MLVVDLQCAHGHRFEGWFASADDLASQQARGLVSCPTCGEREVVRRPSAPHLHTSALAAEPRQTRNDRQRRAGQGDQPGQPPGQQSSQPLAHRSTAHAPQSEATQDTLQAMQSLYLQAVRHIVQHTEDVGERFADEVRSMHHGDAPERAIRGQASPQEKQALREEGIDVLSLPIPEGLDGPLQ
jgi:hypothetical protein